MYLYQINDKGDTLRKIQLTTGKSIFEQNLKKTPIKGDIIKIVKETLDGIYVLSKANDKYQFYYVVNELDFQYVLLSDSNDDGQPFAEINDIFYYAQNEQNIYLILFQKNSEYPVNNIHSMSEKWKAVK